MRSARSRPKPRAARRSRGGDRAIYIPLPLLILGALVVLAALFWALRRRTGERDLMTPPRPDSPRPAAPAPAVVVAPVELPEELRRELWNLIHTGNPIQAIKLVRDRTGLGLKEAHDYVEAMRQNDVTLR